MALDALSGAAMLGLIGGYVAGRAGGRESAGWPAMARRLWSGSFPLRGWRRLGTLAAAVTLTALTAECSTDRSAALQDFPGSTRQQIVAERDNAAVVQLVVQYKATVSVPTLGVNSAALDTLGYQVVAQAANGQIASDTKTLLDAWTRAIAANPNAYFTADPPSQDSPVTLRYQCSGSIVTPDGYIVTAAHCTKVPADELQQDYIEAGFPKIRDATVQKFQAEAFQGGDFDGDQQKQLTDAVTTFLTTHVHASGEPPTYSTLFASAGDSSSEHEMPVTMVTQGNAPAKSTAQPGDKDVSIVKLDGYTDLPTLPVASDADVEAGQQVYIDGYPAAASAGSKSTVTSPTITSGTINSKQRSDQGVPILGTSATTSFGNSGGPALNDSGQMVGVVSYGRTEASYNFLIGGSVVQQFLREKNIEPRESTTTRLYDVALNDFHRQFYKRALQGFQQVKALDGSHPYVDSYIQRSTEAINQGKDQTPPLEGTSLVLAIAGAAALVLILAGAVTFLLVSRSRRRRAAPPPVPQPATWTQPPAGVPQPWGGPPAAPPGAAPPQPPPTQGWSPPPAAQAGPAQAPQRPDVQPPAGQAPGPPPWPGGSAPPADVAWRWDGQRWVPVPVGPGADPAPPGAPADPPRSPAG
jgi:serine protease Do